MTGLPGPSKLHNRRAATKPRPGTRRPSACLCVPNILARPVEQSQVCVHRSSLLNPRPGQETIIPPHLPVSFINMSPPGDFLVADITNLLEEARQRRGSALFYHSPVEASYYAPAILLSEPGASARPRTATSATSASAIFDTMDGQSSSSVSTAPPRRGPEPVHLEWAPIPDFSAAWLPCEFRRLSGCEARFGLDQVESWIEHIIVEHLRGLLPWRSICWFCDYAEFQAASGWPEDQHVAYWSRMYHIAGHFRDGMTGAEDALGLSLSGPRPRQ